jgi:23S rRNA pseudouridine1911/1915/1917 synthase
MVIAKTSKAASRISAQFRDRTVGKIYEALCLGRPDPAEADLSQLLARDGDITRPAAEGEAGSICRLSYAVVEDGTIAELRVSRLKIDLLTGFKHQIRAQLASIGHPVYGDGRYGAPETPRGGQAIGLCSISLSLSHPIGGRALKFDCRPEDFWPFSDFKADRRAPRGAPPPGRPLD